MNRMEYEKSLVSSKGREGSEKTSRLVEGMSYLLEKLRGEEPWETLWPCVHKTNFCTAYEGKLQWLSFINEKLISSKNM